MLECIKGKKFRVISLKVKRRESISEKAAQYRPSRSKLNLPVGTKKGQAFGPAPFLFLFVSMGGQYRMGLLYGLNQIKLIRNLMALIGGKNQSVMNLALCHIEA